MQNIHPIRTNGDSFSSQVVRVIPSPIDDDPGELPGYTPPPPPPPPHPSTGYVVSDGRNQLYGSPPEAYRNPVVVGRTQSSRPPNVSSPPINGERNGYDTYNNNGYSMDAMSYRSPDSLARNYSATSTQESSAISRETSTKYSGEYLNPFENNREICSL
jgi:hypothetical protein